MLSNSNRRSDQPLPTSDFKETAKTEGERETSIASNTSRTGSTSSGGSSRGSHTPRQNSFSNLRIPPSVVVQPSQYQLDTIDRPSVKTSVGSVSPAEVSPVTSSSVFDLFSGAMEAAADDVPRGSQSVIDGSKPRRSARNRRSNSDIPVSMQGGLLNSSYYVGSGQPGIYGAPPPPMYPFPYGQQAPNYSLPFAPQQQPYPVQPLYQYPHPSQQQQQQHVQQQQYAHNMQQEQQYGAARNTSPRLQPQQHPNFPVSSLGPPPLPNREHSMSHDGEKKPLLGPSAKIDRRFTANPKRANPRKHHHGHRRSLSSSAAMPEYGSFWSSTEEQHDDMQLLHSQQERNNMAQQPNFSPRAEIRKLAQGLSPSGSLTGRKKAPAFPSSRNSNVYWSPQTPSSRSVYQPSPTIGGGEAAFFQQSSPRHHRSESIRKMHVRNQSAQLFMEDIKGVEQPLACRNVSFLLLFVFHLLFVAYMGQIFGKEALKYHGEDSEQVTIVYSSLVYIAGWSGLFAVLISALLLGAMTYFARHFVQIALFVVITLSFIWGTIGIGLSPKTAVPVTGIIALALAVAYTLIVWDRIPFAAANLVTALSGIRAFPGIVVVAFGFQALALVWSVFFSIVAFGLYDAMQEHGKLEKLSLHMTYVVYALLMVSFLWTFQVLQGTVQAITAAVIGGWWHKGRTQDNEGLVRVSCFKTIFYSMGSICFGSLFVGPVRLLRLLSVLFRPSSSETSYNAWAFTYVGMYHYGFLDAGNNATELFDRRGWSTIVSDDLVPNVLFLASLVIGGITGCFAHVLSQIDGLAVTPKDQPGLAPFVEGVVIGLVLPSVVFSLISSAVNAVLVCFASSPLDFERQHPELSHEMRSAWREVWPKALDVRDARPDLALLSEHHIHSSIRAPSPYVDFPVL